MSRQLDFPTPPIVVCPHGWNPRGHLRHGERPAFSAPSASAEGGPFAGSDPVIASPPVRLERRGSGKQTTDLSHTADLLPGAVADRNAHQTNSEVHLILAEKRTWRRQAVEATGAG